MATTRKRSAGGSAASAMRTSTASASGSASRRRSGAPRGPGVQPAPAERLAAETLPPALARRAAAAPAVVTETPQRVAIDRAFLDRAELRRGLTDNLRALRSDAGAVTDRVTAAFAGWDPGALSEGELTRRNFVPPGTDPTDALDRVIERRVAGLKAAKSHPSMTIRKGGSSGPLVASVADGTGTIKLGPLVSYIAERQESLLSFEATPAIAACSAELEATKVIAEIDATRPADHRSGHATERDGVVDATDVDELVDRAVNRQMRSATAPEDRPVFEPIPTGERGDKAQAALLETFQLRPGASDVPSYHDFNTLQIAFEHVWTQIFDGEIESIGRELYKEYVGLKDFLGYDAPDTPITTIDDLRRLMAEIKELSQIAQAELPGSLGGGTTGDDHSRSAGELGGDETLEVGLGIATGGLSALIQWVLDEISRAGQKPVLRWDDVDGGVLGRGDRITATIEAGVAQAGLVELVLLTDVGSHRKDVAFQTYVQEAAKFVNVVHAANTAKNVVSQDGKQYYRASTTFQAESLPIGVFEFASEETPAFDLGRYVLSGLGERLANRSRVTFYWTDS